MSSSIDTIWASFLTVALSGVVASAIAFRLNANFQRAEAKRSKLEEAYVATHNYWITLSTHYLKYYAVFKGEVTIDQANDLTIKSDVADRSAFLRLEMLTALYAPAAQTALDQLVEHRTRANAVISEHRRRYLRGEGATPDLIAPFTSVLDGIDAQAAEIKRILIREARKL